MREIESNDSITRVPINLIPTNLFIRSFFITKYT